MSVKPIPEGYHTLTPFLTVRDAVRAILRRRTRRRERSGRQSHARRVEDWRLRHHVK
jgi:hypothetical protein